MKKKFCGRCGRPLDEDTGKCFYCVGKVKPKKEKSAFGKIGKGGGKKTIVIVAVIVALLLVAVAGAFLFKGIDLPFGKSYIDEPFEVEWVDTDAYYEENAEVIGKSDAKDSGLMLKEKEVYDLFYERGFLQYPITTNYDKNGDYIEEEEISENGSAKHPIYQAYYVTENGEQWCIIVIGSTMIANPLFYNYESATGVPLTIVETDTVLGYDAVTNVFYEIVPNSSAMIMKKVERIDAATINSLTKEVIKGL